MKERTKLKIIHREHIETKRKLQRVKNRIKNKTTEGTEDTEKGNKEIQKAERSKPQRTQRSTEETTEN